MQDAKNCKGMKDNYVKKMTSENVNNHLKDMLNKYRDVLANTTINYNVSKLLDYSESHLLLQSKKMKLKNLTKSCQHLSLGHL